MTPATFWREVDSSAGAFECWPWMRYRNPEGYGRLSMPGRTRIQYAHRVALELSLGRPLEAGMQALHRCDNPPCCNPAHLFEGTNADNMRDKATKGRSYRSRRLTVLDAERIRRATGRAAVRRLAGQFPNVSVRTLYRARNREGAYSGDAA